MKIQNVVDVARWRLCLGCGACRSTCPEKKITLIDVEDDGIRPVMQPGGCGACDVCVQACPGINTSLPAESAILGEDTEQTRKRWGAFNEVWEGYASDPEIRFRGSSGGLCTALSLFCLERGVASGVLHVGSDPGAPWKNKTVRSMSKQALEANTGSRYAPASPCDSFDLIEAASGQSVFVGKPCDVAGLRMAQRLKPLLAEKTSLAIGFFCAGTPSTLGTLDLLRAHGVECDAIAGMRYRGMGWPGMATVDFKGDTRAALKLSYQESWGFLQKYRPFRCYLCPDLTAEFADISVGDPWYRDLGDDEPGRSLILLRTERGREIFHQAVQHGYVTAEPVEPGVIYRSQKNLLGKRQAIWGRLLAMRLLGIPYPKLTGFHLLKNWTDLPVKEKIRSILGTVKRIIRRNYFTPLARSNSLDRK